MDRIGPAGGSPTGALSNGQQGFVDENLAAGQEGTTVVSPWLNALQESLMDLQVAGGVTVPNIADFTQITTAVIGLIAAQFALTVSGTTWSNSAWSFSIPMPGGTPLIVQGFHAGLEAGQESVSWPLCTTMGIVGIGFIAGFATDGGEDAYSYAVSPGPDNSHATIYCPTTQPIGGSFAARGACGCSVIVIGS
jgi:hypothetical protein